MSHFRSYFEKNNTIIKNSQVNTAKNPNTEIFYGSSFSKFIFKVDFQELKHRIDKGEYVIDGNTKHTLKMTNTVFGDDELKGKERGTGRKRATSFDLIIFKVPEHWDEGVGFDYENEPYDFAAGSNTFDNRPSNWFNRTTLNKWSLEGVYASEPEVIGKIHFDNGDEDIEADITEYVNGIILNGDTNHGIGLAFDLPYQEFEDEIDKSVSFFTKYTQTFFEPFVETSFDDTIKDDRAHFIGEKIQNLYLYVTKGTNFHDLDTLPTVDVFNSTGTIISGLNDIPTIKVKKGIYLVRFGLSGELCDGKRFFHDQWKGLEIDGIKINPVKQKFIPQPYTAQFNIGENVTELQSYAVQFSGIKQNEKIKRGEKRKIVVTFRSIDVAKPQLFEEVYYRVFITEGRTQVEIHDWTLLDRTNENSFHLDTAYYIPREYFIELKGKTHTEEIFYNNHIKFEIVSEK
jgi:hypothetical protein